MREDHSPSLPPIPMSQIRPSCISISRVRSACSTLDKGTKETTQSDSMPAAQEVEALVADYGKLVFHVIVGLTGDWQESQDLTQDTFVQALRAVDAARQASGAHFHAKAWLLQIASVSSSFPSRRLVYG